ncbi:predicted protein [Uncinocarpus reesii 1704]|uniref:Uncharacterized protein n=1 Tax=Uncinocarpus reesii (strain UAMH 1704) TaxID=336963 RepID=C4JTP3_UNCRE|nr:uncharacterized protein UREG_05832 [Uncinocarpus reesii 1704]EEP80990.1 predicted protein [Uncinocarpus reesii 1704]
MQPKAFLAFIALFPAIGLAAPFQTGLRVLSENLMSCADVLAERSDADTATNWKRAEANSQVDSRRRLEFERLRGYNKGNTKRADADDVVNMREIQ